ncbi:MAG: discoidin domain-containing protein [Clostridia bacterium]|nr:discoidin domain-containing protein [Clostridia bacterium]
MIKSKLIRIFLAAVLCVQVLPYKLSFAEAYGETKTELVNVAMFKPVSVSAGPVYGDPVNLVDDHNNTDLVLSYGNFMQWVTVDLQRRYKISHIDVAARSNTADAVWLSDFEIQASNTADFSEFEVLDTCSSADGEKLPVLGKANMTFSGSADSAYRYVRLYSGHMMGFSELRVYAMQTVTEVKPENTAAGTVWNNDFSYVSDMAADGNLNTAWVGNYGGDRDFVRLDMGGAHNIGYMELYARRNNGDEPGARNYFALYGTNDITGISDADNLDAAELSEYGYTKLAYLKNPAVEKPDFDYNPYPAGGKYAASVNDETAYRYITYKKLNTEHSQLAEFKVYEVNPVINSAVIKGNTLTVEFSDEMNTDTFSGIRLINDNTGEILACNGAAADGYTYSIDISDAEKSSPYRLTAENVTNLKNVPVYGELSLGSLNEFSCMDFDFEDENGNTFSNILDVSTAGAAAKLVNMSDTARTAAVAAAVYENGQLKNIAFTEKTVGKGGRAAVSASLPVPEQLCPGREFKAFLWETTDGAIRPMSPALQLTEKTRYDIYVSADGSDSGNGTAVHPFRTLEQAQRAVREINSDMQRDINVNIEPGVYELQEVWRFNDTDSGENGYRVNYRAAGDVTVSGGRRVDGWEQVYGNLYRVPYSGESRLHELYVNGVKAVRAAADNKVTPKGFYCTDDGIPQGVLADIQYAALRNPEDIQLHYARGWKSIVCNVKDIIAVDDNKAAFVIGDDFVKATSAGAHSVQSDSRFYLENVFEYLDEPGEYYYDEREGYIYYMTDGSAAVEAYAPVLEQLVDIAGSDLNRKVHNITFDGITFAHAAWNYPVDNGYIGGQAQSFSGEKKKTALDELGVNITDAAVQISAAENIEFINGSFTGIAKVGVGLYKGASNNLIEGNAFYSIGDSAVTVGLPSDNYMEPEYEGYNLAFNKVCTASNDSDSYPPYDAADGSAKTGWHSVSADGSYKNAWWQVDLGAEYEIDRIEIDARSGYDQPTTKRYFEVIASNDPEFADGGVRLALCGAEGFGVEETWRADVNENGKYRYVRVRKTVNEYMFLAEIRVINLSMEHVPQKEVCKNNRIYNNCITAIGEFNFGAPGIQTYYTDNVDIAHNYIYNVPYTGIALGWGWTTYPDSVTSRNNKIRNNVIDNFTLVNMDGGGIYTLAQQPGSVISGNYIKNQNNVYGAVYPDNGSADYTVSGNVLENVWLSFFIYSRDKKNLVFDSNYSTTSVMENYGENCFVTNTKYFVPGNMPAEAKAIADAAGPAEEYKSVFDRIKIIPHKYTAEEIWDNVLGEVSGSMTDAKLAQYCLRNIVSGARTIYDTAENSKLGYSKQAFADLQAAIDKAQSEYVSIKAEIDAAVKAGISPVSAIIDRNRIVSAKAELDTAVKDFLSSERN